MGLTAMPINTPTHEPEYGISEAIAALGLHPNGEQLAAFWSGIGAQSPIIEPDRPGHSRVTFLWRGDAPAVYVTLNRVTSTLEQATLHRLIGTDLWHRTFVMPNTWRSSYTMIVPTEEQMVRLRDSTPRWAMRIIRESGQPDPKNPLRTRTHSGRMSEVALTATTECALLDSSLATAKIDTTELRTPTGRRAWLLTPRTSQAASQPLLIMLDGGVWHANGAVAQVLSTLGPDAPAALLLEPEPDNRVEDYGPDSGHPDEIVEIILPWIRTITAISDDPAHITVCGESLGGLTALRTIFAHPSHVRNAIVQSSSLWATDLSVHVPATAPTLNVRMSVGTYEDRMRAQHYTLHDALAATGHTSHLTEFTGGHDMAWWVQLWAESVRLQHAQ